MVSIVFPHQLFKKNPLIASNYKVFIVEEYLFFNQYNFHKQKIAFHRATMKTYVNYIQPTCKEIIYIDAQNPLSDVRKLIKHISEEGHEQIQIIDPEDDWLLERIKYTAKYCNLTISIKNNPIFINSIEDLEDYFEAAHPPYFQTDFYIKLRKKYNILIEKGTARPKGGHWSYDKENRKKYPAKKSPPSIEKFLSNDVFDEAINYTEKFFPNNLGTVGPTPLYPISFEDAEIWFQDFLKERYLHFGDYEDAIVEAESLLHHSVLSPLLNTGLLTPQFVINEALSYSKKHEIPLNSTEGFIRQILGWREFIRGVYRYRGRVERTKNFWGFTRKMPQSFYRGETGILPFDKTISKVLKSGYCHHIERLMILGNFMLLCEINPNDIYKWFMELFIDAYDWVMVPNVYGMSQFADGGLMSTKPYISGSNYILKMSDYKNGDWTKIWDGLFWSYMEKHRDYFTTNPRMKVLLSTYDRFDSKKQRELKNTAKNFIANLS
ncbi:cryptochrome/photolyase family protein [Membranihabitans maritimus]|uniref:cryptochrome/photolyase family protein n=1 Tax=Membranihabitans maritimus TaxID=2904244 RepID=UPI001F3A050F|nr:cryptochrome/photolyase family protein [Membranihabitans maritimus]